MVEQEYYNYRLYRTLTKLSGNMQIDLVLSPYMNNLVINQAHLRPVSSLIPFVPDTNEYILNRPHRLNIKNFYEKTRDNFYEFRAKPELMNDWYWMVPASQIKDLKYIKNWDDTYWAGTKRMSYQLYKRTHEILVPLWLEKAEALRFVIKVGSSNSYTLEIDHSSNTNFEFHNNFAKYIKEYFDDTRISSGNNDVMYVNYKKNLASLSGLSLSSGNYVNRNDYNIARNIIFRERPLLENNSLITNAFPDYKLIVPQHINFNLCFNADDIIANNPGIKSDALKAIISCDVYTKNNGKWELLEVRDFYTNHEYVPRITYSNKQQVINQEYNDEFYWKNALDHLCDYKCTSMIHQNKITQSICHWVLCDSPDDNLFNVYDGFGAVVMNDGWTEVQGTYDHGFGVTQDINDTSYNDTINNTSWANISLIGDGNDVEEILNHPQKYIDEGILCDTSNHINGIKFQYYDDPASPNYATSPEKIYICTMTTPREAQTEEWITAQTQLMTSQQYIGILTHRLSPTGSDLDLPEDRNNISSDFDRNYDWHVHSDIDNRWAMYYTKDGKKQWSLTNGQLEFGKNGPNIYLREYNNVGMLYVCTRRMNRYLSDGKLDPKAPLICVFWSPRVFIEEEKMDGGITNKHVMYGNLEPKGIVLGELTKALQDYWNKYSDLYDDLKESGENPGSLPNMEEFGFVVDAMESYQSPEVIFFHRGILADTDITISQHASEIRYKKYDNVNNYVFRYHGKIKPAIFSPKTTRHMDQLYYLPVYGRNFLYEKTLVFPNSINNELSKNYTMPDGLLKFVHTGVAPKYPSVGYDSIMPSVRYGSVMDNFTRGNNGVLPSKHGDLLYNEPHPKLLGKDMYGYEFGSNSAIINSGDPDKYVYSYVLGLNEKNYSFSHVEYKWFDKSQIIKLPVYVEEDITIPSNSKQLLEESALEMLQNKITDINLDISYLKKTYQFEYILRDIETSGSNKNILYRYTIKAEFK